MCRLTLKSHWKSLQPSASSEIVGGKNFSICDTRRTDGLEWINEQLHSRGYREREKHTHSPFLCRTGISIPLESPMISSSMWLSVSGIASSASGKCEREDGHDEILSSPATQSTMSLNRLWVIWAANHGRRLIRTFLEALSMPWQSQWFFFRFRCIVVCSSLKRSQDNAERSESSCKDMSHAREKEWKKEFKNSTDHREDSRKSCTCIRWHVTHERRRTCSLRLPIDCALSWFEKQVCSHASQWN